MSRGNTIELKECAFHDGLQVDDVVAARAEQQKRERVVTEGLLVLKVGVSRNEQIELSVDRAKELAVLQTCVTCFRYGPNLMIARERLLQGTRKALIEQNAQAGAPWLLPARR